MTKQADYMQVEDVGRFHVYPLNDDKEHTLEGLGCECKPRVEIENGREIVIHNSYDGREKLE